MGDCKSVCNDEGLCLLQQQLMAQSLLSFGNLVTTSHNQDIDYLKTNQVVTMAAIGKQPVQLPVV